MISMLLSGTLIKFYNYETNIDAWGVACCDLCVGLCTEEAL